MSAVITPTSEFRLSICITTLNRAAFIGETLRNVLSQITDECEVIVLDAASTDETEQVVTGYISQCATLRYIKQDVNNGVDRDYDRTVELARGEYCWLMTDDDLLMQGAVAAVLKSLRRRVSAVLVNAEIHDVTMSKVLLRRWLNVESDRVYQPEETEQLFVDAANFLKYIGGVVIKRAVWLERERKRYYGSWFIHVGVMFQKRLPDGVAVIAEPLIALRWGNAHSFSPKVMEILFSTWPALGESVAPSQFARSEVHSLEPWKHFLYLLEMRSLGYYSIAEYRRWFRPRLRFFGEKIAPVVAAIVPGVLANLLFVAYYSLSVHHYRDLRLHDLKRCRFYLPNKRTAKPVW